MVYFYGNDYRSFSFGIVCQYEFVRVLREHGIPAMFICAEARDDVFPMPQKYSNLTVYALPGEMKPGEEDIVVYPETIPGNPLKAKRVIRWLLNQPYSLTSEGIDYGDTDQVFAYSKFVDPDLPQMFYLPDERKLFSEIRENGKHEKSTISLYFGKTHLDVIRAGKEEIGQILSQYKTRHVITRMEPARREEALRRIADSDMLLSFDSFSNMNFEANLLGVPVLIFEDAYGIKGREFNVPLRGFAYSMEELEDRRGQVDRVFEDYCSCIESQEQALTDSVRSAVEAFDAMESNKSLAESNREKNEKLRKKDLESYQEKWKGRKPFATVLFPYELPFYLLKMIGADYSIRTLPGHLWFLLKNFLRTSLDFLGLLEPVRRFRKMIRAKWNRKA